MSFLQPLMLIALPLISLPIVIHLINQWRYQTKQWGAMRFLLAANKMNRGFARIRRWLILAMRTLAILGLLVAVARPLSSGLLGWTGGGRADTVILIVDRSPSMMEQGRGGKTKLETGAAQLEDAVRKLGSDHWVSIDAATGQAQEFASLDALVDSTLTQPVSASSDFSALLQATLDYLQTNKPGPTEIWIASDLRTADWRPDEASWNVLREGFANLPQSVRFNLLAFPELPQDNVSVRVTESKRVETVRNGIVENALLLSMHFDRVSEQDVEGGQSEPLAVQIEIDGARSEIQVELTGQQTEIRNQRIVLAADQESGWGSVTIPADANNADNTSYFVYATEPMRRIVVVSEDPTETRALEVAASISADGEANSAVEVLSPSQLDSLTLDDTALVLWQANLPDSSAIPALDNYVSLGGQIVFFPPSGIERQAASQAEFMGVGWESWTASQGDERVRVENWRGDQDLLAATLSGVGLPVGQLELSGFASLRTESPLVKLATLTGGHSLLSRVPTDQGGVYFCSASAAPDRSTLAESGIVLFVAIQRAIEQGQQSLGKTSRQIAQPSNMPTDDWRRLAGAEDAISTDYSMHSGVFKQAERLFAINRPIAEDSPALVADEKLASIFAGLQFSRVDGSAGSLSGIVREVWRVFLILMICALLLEALLCIPRPSRQSQFSNSAVT